MNEKPDWKSVRESVDRLHLTITECERLLTGKNSRPFDFKEWFNFKQKQK